MKISVMYLVVATAAHGAIFTVTNTNDAGPETLRQSILDANATGGDVLIGFNIEPTGTVHTIMLESPLPAITATGVVINGFTQPGSSPNTSSNGNNTVLMIKIDGANSGGDGFVFAPGANGGAIVGVSICGFPGHGVVLDSFQNTVTASYIGVAPDGAAEGNGGDGVLIRNSSNRVGGRAPGNRGVISDNGGSGVRILNAGGNIVEGQFIGTTVGGDACLGNMLDGVYIFNGANNNIGEVAAGARNIISGNESNGVHIAGTSANNNNVRGNFIGTDFTGTLPVPNKGHGALLTGGSLTRFELNDIGYNLGNGITVAGTADFYRLDRNRIFGHVFCGLAVDVSGASNPVNAPFISGVSTGATTAIFGSYAGMPNSTVSIEVFANTECNHRGFGEAEIPIAATTTTTGPSGVTTWSATMTGVPPAPILTAQATESSFALPPKTGGLSACFDVNASNTVLTITQTEDPNPVPFGAGLSYTFNIANVIRALAATDVEFEFEAPQGFTTIGAAGDGWALQITNGLVRGSRSFLDAGQNAPSITITGAAPAASGAKINRADIRAGNARRVTVGGVVVVLPVRADLAVSKIANTNSVVTGDFVTYSIVVTNRGPDDVPVVSVSERIVPGLVVRQTAGSGWECFTNLSLFHFICNHGTLAAGAATPPLMVTVETFGTGIFTNRVLVSGREGSDLTAPHIDDSNPDNDEAFAVVTVQAPPPIVCSLSPAVATNEVREFHSVTVTLTQGGNPVPGKSVTFSVISGPNTAAMGTGTTDSNGQASFQYLGGGTPGTDTIQATGDGFGCTATKVWIAAPAPGVGCELCPEPRSGERQVILNSEPCPEATNTVGGVQQFGLALTADGSPAAGITIDFRVIEGPGSNQTASAVTDTNGVAVFTVTNDGNPGTDVVQGTGVVQGQSFTCTVARVTWTVPPETVADLILIKTASTDRVVTGGTFTYSIIVSNAGPDISDFIHVEDFAPPGATYGNRGGPGWECFDVGPNDFFLCIHEPLPANTATAPIVLETIAPNFATSLTNSALSLPIEGSTVLDPNSTNDVGSVVVEVVPALPIECALAPGIATNEVFSFHSVTVTVTQASTPVPGVPVNFTVTGVNSNATGTAQTDANGQAQFQYLGSNRPGTDTIQASGDGFSCTAIKVWLLKIGAACELMPGTVTNTTGGTQMYAARVTNNDEPAANVGVTFQVTEGPGAGQMDTALTDTNGVAQFTLTNDGTPGTDSLQVNGTLDGMAFSCVGDCTWETASPVLCSLSPAVATNNVSEFHSVTVTVTQASAPLPGVTVNFSVTGVNSNAAATKQTDANGQADFSYLGGVNAGIDVIQAAGDGFSCTATKVWVTGAAPVCSISPAMATNVVSTTHFFDVTVLQDGLPVGGAEVSFSVIAGPNAGAGEAKTTLADGTASFFYTSNGAAGTDDILVTVNGDVFCAATKVWVPELSCSVVPALATNETRTIHRFTVTVLRGTVPAAGVDVEFSVIGPNSGVTDADTTLANGQVTFSYTGGSIIGEDAIFVDATDGFQQTRCRATAVWVRSVSTEIQEFIGEVEKLNLPKGIGTSLTKKLEAAKRLVDRGKFNPALSQVLAFIRELEALKKAGKLDAATADQLIKAAEDLVRHLRVL